MFDEGSFLARTLNGARDFLPTLALALLVLACGWILAAFFRRLVRWLVRRTGLEALGEKVGVAKFVYAVGARKGLAAMLGQVAYIAVLLLAVSTSADILGLTTVASFVSAATAYLPRLLSALGVFVAGLWVANLVRSWVSSGGGRSRLSSPALVAQLAYHAILVVAVTMAAEQAGLDTELVGTLIAIGVAALAFGFATAFALGARVSFESIVARHYCESTFRVGDVLSVRDSTGPLVRYTSTSAMIQASDGTILVVPCAQLLRDAVLLTLPTEAID